MIQCKVDVTSTADDIRLQVQLQTDIKAWSIEIYHEGKKVNFWERVCYFSNPNFQAKWHTHVRMPDDIAVVVNRNQISIPPAHSDVTVAAKLSTLRFAIRHPIWTTIRTVSMPIHEKLSVVLDKIFPDLKSQMQINMTDEKGNVLNDLEVSMINIGAYYEVEFNASKSYPVTQIEIVQPVGIEDQMIAGGKCNPELPVVKKWVRTPFQTKPYEQRLNENMTLNKVAAQFFAHSCSTQTIMAMIDGKVVDPRIKVGEVHDDKIITFRACPMLGGGKEKDKDVKKILTDQLLSRGVPDDKIVSRVDGFLSKVASDKVRTHSGETWAKQWVSLKQLANEARVSFDHH